LFVDDAMNNKQISDFVFAYMQEVAVRWVHRPRRHRFRGCIGDGGRVMGDGWHRSGGCR
jgi:hypothetical protein